MTHTIKTISWVILFAIAMGFLESSVVIYLRELYYKSGFEFPLKPIAPNIAKVEFIREIATIIMLIGIGYTAGKNALQRFAYFNLAFAIWDLLYYAFLFIFLGWPSSIYTWDILFLVPYPWVGPVWAPCLLALLMIVGSLYVIRQIDKDPLFKISQSFWISLIIGSLICILSFMWDYIKITSSQKLWSIFSTEPLFSELNTYVPETFNYVLFFFGFFLMLISVISHMYLNIIKPKKQTP